MNFDSEDGSLQFLTFFLDKEVFALEITKVREVLEFTSVTRVPRVPDFMRGVINLRGSVVPVMDLRLKFGMSKTVKTINTCVIIVEVEIENEEVLLGVMADSVKEVLDLDISQIVAPPKVGTKTNTDFMKGMGKVQDEFVMILEMNKVFSIEEITMVKDTNDSNRESVSATEGGATE